MSDPANDPAPPRSDAGTPIGEPAATDSRTVEPDARSSLSNDWALLLAQEYTDCSFSRAEFISFEYALSAAILVFENAEQAMQHVHDELTTLERSRAHRVPGWEAEADLVLGESQAVAADALSMTYGLATVMAAAALERLISDVSTGRSKGGLMPSLDHLLEELGVESDERQSLLGAVRPIAKARNAFAHGLLGSDWPYGPVVHPCTRSTTMDSFRVVAQIGERLEQACM